MKGMLFRSRCDDLIHSLANDGRFIMSVAIFEVNSRNKRGYRLSGCY